MKHHIVRIIIMLQVRRQLPNTIFKLRYLNDYKAEDVLLTPDNQRFPWQTSQKYSWKKIVSTTIEQYFIIEDYFSNRKIKWYFKNHIMKFIKIVWSLHCLGLLDPDCNYFLQKYFLPAVKASLLYLVLVANPPRATTSVFLSHLSWQPSSLLTTPLNLQYWEEERTNTPGSEAVGQSPAV